MPTRHETDMITSPLTPGQVAERYGLNDDEAGQIATMNKYDQELADYAGYPEIQASIILERRENETRKKKRLTATGSGIIKIAGSPLPVDESRVA
jgi:hypothetical protein